MKILRIFLAYMLFQLATSKYSYVTTLTASTPYMQDGFGSEFSLVVNGTMLILAANVPNVFSNPHVEIFKSYDNGQTWLYSQSISCCPTSPSFEGEFATAFSDNGETLLISNLYSFRLGGATLYYNSNGQYLNISLDITCKFHDNSFLGSSAALSGDGKWSFVSIFESLSFVYTNTQTGECLQVGEGILAESNILTAANHDGSTFVIGCSQSGNANKCDGFLFVYTEFSYQSPSPTPYQINVGSSSISLTLDGSILAVGSCGCCVYIYNISDFTAPLTSPIQIIPPPLDSTPNIVSFGCNVDISNDGMKLVVGSSSASNGYSYAYSNVGGVYLFDMILIPPESNPSYGSGGIAVVNTPFNTSIILVGGPTSGIQQSGQIAVFKSVPYTSATATPTASASSSSTFSAIATSSSTATPTSSASATATSSATATATTTSTSTPSTTPSSQPINALAANSSVIGVTSGISIFGGIKGSVIGYFLIRWLRRRLKTNKAALDSINSTSNKESLLELYST